MNSEADLVRYGHVSSPYGPHYCLFVSFSEQLAKYRVGAPIGSGSPPRETLDQLLEFFPLIDESYNLFTPSIYSAIHKANVRVVSHISIEKFSVERKNTISGE